MNKIGANLDQIGARRVVLTGGHAATPAVAVVEELLRRQPKRWNIYWIGARQAIEGKEVVTLESEVFPKLGVKSLEVAAGRIQRRFSLWTIPALLKIPLGFFHALILLTRIKPKIILSFGGYAAYPVVLAGWLMRIPVIIHEQTAAAGRANRASSFFAKKICLARPESLNYFPKGKCIITGNPVMTQVAEISPKTQKAPRPVVFITLGSRGSQRINEAVAPIIERLLADFLLIHLTGPIDIAKFREIKKRVPAEVGERYEVYDRVDPMQIDNLYREADIVIGRAGANTVSEIMATCRPAVLIPIPWSYLNEQMTNALAAQKFGIAEVLPEDRLTPESLLEAVEKINSKWETMVRGAAKKESPDKEAAKKLVDLLEETVG